MSNLKDGFRALTATPIVSLVAILSLALGIGANTAIFSILDSLMLRTLPVREPQRLVAIAAEGEDVLLDYRVWIALRDRDLLDGAFAWARDGAGRVEDGQTKAVSVLWVSGGFFDTLGVPAALGRTLRESDDRRGGGPGGPVAVVSDGFWRRRLGADPAVIGRTLTLDRVTFTIAGVAPARFFGLEVGAPFDVILPLETEPLLGRLPSRLKHWPWLHVTGRLPPDRSAAAASAALLAAQPRIRTETMPDFERGEDRDEYLSAAWSLRPAATGTSRLRRRYGTALQTLWVVAG